MAPSIRSAFLSVHRWLGLVLAVALAILALTGALLAFEEDLTRTLNHRLMQVTPGDHWLALATLEQAIQRDYPDDRVRRWNLPQRPDDAAVAQLEHGPALFVDPYRGTILGTGRAFDTTMRTVHRLHTQLLLGPIGRGVIGWTAVGLLVLNLSGAVLWWRRRITRVRAGTSGAVFRFELHQATAFASWLFLTTLATTGIVLHWEQDLLRLVDHVGAGPMRSIERPPGLGAALPDTHRGWSADDLLARAQALVPAARPTAIDYQEPGGPVRIMFKYPEDHTPSGRTNVFLDPRDGALRELSDLRAQRLGFKLAKLWSRDLHTGLAFGLAGQVLMCAAALGLLTLVVTGPAIWYVRRRGAARGRPASPPLVSRETS